jgi:hypothetical protein
MPILKTKLTAPWRLFKIGGSLPTIDNLRVGRGTNTCQRALPSRGDVDGRSIGERNGRYCFDCRSFGDGALPY